MLRVHGLVALVLLVATPVPALKHTPADTHLALFSEGLQQESQEARNECAKTKGFLSMLKNLRNTVPNDVLRTMRKAFDNTTGPVVMSVNTMHMRCLFDNFVSQLTRTKPSTAHIDIMAMNLDPESQAFCLKRRGNPMEKNIFLQCIEVSGWIDGKSGDPREQNLAHGAIGGDNCLYIKITWTKPALLYHASKMGKNGVFLFDADIILNGDPFQWVKQYKKDTTEICMGDDSKSGRQIPPNPNSGSTYVDHLSHKILEEWCDMAGDATVISSMRGEQQAMSALVQKNAGHLPEHRKWKRLQLIPRGQIGQQGRHGKYGTHYNTGTQKRPAMEKAGFWKPKDPDCKEYTK